MGAVPVFIWLLTLQRGGRPQQICSSIKYAGVRPDQRCSVHYCVTACVCVCVCVCVCSAPIGAVCHAVICVLAGGHWGSADNPTFPLHARSSSESDRYRTVSHRCPGASKFTFGQRQTLRHTAVLARTKKKKKKNAPYYSPGRGTTLCYASTRQASPSLNS